MLSKPSKHNAMGITTPRTSTKSENNKTILSRNPPPVHSPSTPSFTCICRNPEICREISRRWAQELDETQFSKFVKLPRRNLMDIIDDNAQVGKHVSAYRKAALHCLGYTADDGDDDDNYDRRGRIGVGVVERISIVHFHPSVIPVILLQEEEGEGQQSDHDGRSRSSCSSSSRKRKLDKGRIPYVLGQSLGMPNNSLHLSPTLDSSGAITYFALPNYNMNHAAIDVADAIMTNELKHQEVNSNGTMMMMATSDPTMVTNSSIIGQRNEPLESTVLNTNAVRAELSLDQLRRDNIQMLKMYIQLAERYEQEVKARIASEQLSLVLTSELKKMLSLLNNSTNSSTVHQFINNGAVGGCATAAINTAATPNSVSNDINAGNQGCVVAKLLELLQCGKGPYAGYGGSGYTASASSFSSIATVRGGGGGKEGVEGSRDAGTFREHVVAAWAKDPTGSLSVQNDKSDMLLRLVSMEAEKRQRGA